MTSTRGRKPLPLPASLREGLERAGLFQLEQGEEPRPWRHALVPELQLRIVASSIPGDTMVTATFDRAPRRVEADVVLAEALLRVQAAERGERAM